MNIPASEKAFFLLSLIASSRGPISAKELSLQSRIPLSSIYRHLTSLSKWSLVQERGIGLYVPGAMAVQLSQGFQQGNTLISWARPLMNELANNTGESVALMMPVAGQVLCIDMIDSSQPLRCCYQKGASQPMYKGASSKVLLAYLSEDARRRVIKERNADVLEHELKMIREQNYATSDSEIDEGVWGVSAPIITGNKKLHGSISLMAPSVRAEKNQQQWIKLTCHAATKLAHILRE
ncbi:IclR family transcriptional regulator [Vibrio algivorus]|uniref:HTH-type transcriptional repressor AllR n=1 Tax=Vibrio algivorus TaxID=1667024 RepID=A0A557P038_9VIBR|nr:IclR family transcriptional regulator [Vibrio algivorus]TVO34028.1 IclR family transcriptional regulator [Vibrio algivorus]GLT13779.1 transcriptional regulator [Vibrio algivorus]